MRNLLELQVELPGFLADAHVKHCTIEVAATLVEYVPMAQLMQAETEDEAIDVEYLPAGHATQLFAPTNEE
jgi:hypothetical protein